MLIRILFFVLLCHVSYAQSSQIRFANIDLRAAKQRATIEDKLIFIDTYTQYCVACKRMNREFADPKVAKYFNKHFINVKIDMETEAGDILKSAYQVVFLPTLMFVDKNGNLKFKVDNAISGAELLAFGKHYQEKIYPGSNPIVHHSTASSTTRPPRTPPTQRKTTSTVSKPTKAVRTKTEPVVAAASTRTSTNTKTKKASNPPVIEKTKPSADDIQDDGRGEKVLYVMGQGGDNLPPEILKQEAYFRLQLMDGSHVDAASKYLDTQSDWSSSANIKFIFDFLYSVQSREFDYMIEQKPLFEKIIGAEKVKQTVDILVTKELERAYPRPNLEQAKTLYGYVSDNHAQDAYEYMLSRYIKEGNKEEFGSLADRYFKTYESQNASLYNDYAVSLLQKSTAKKVMKWAYENIDKAIVLDDKQSSYFLTKAIIEQRMGKEKQAAATAQQALMIAKESGQNILEINKFIDTIL